MTYQEFKKKYLNLNYDAFAIANYNPYIVKISNAAPDSFDWRDRGVGNSVYDQASCGASYAFLAVDILESLYYLNKGVFKSLSEQMIIDCDVYDGGCNGGLPENTFTWLKENGGIMLEKDYPYVAYKQTCKSDPSKYIDMKITEYKKLGSSTSIFSPVDEDEMKEFLYEARPLGVGFIAAPLKTYTGGIIDVPASQCPSSGINLLGLLVGYGHDDASNNDYWIVKNSWGSSWGEKGFFRIKRGSGTCGINCYVITATVSF